LKINEEEDHPSKCDLRLCIILPIATYMYLVGTIDMTEIQFELQI